MWHVRAKGDVRTTLCGQKVAQTVRARPVLDDTPTEDLLFAVYGRCPREGLMHADRAHASLASGVRLRRGCVSSSPFQCTCHAWELLVEQSADQRTAEYDDAHTDQP